MMAPRLREFLLYLIVSGAALGVDTAVFNLSLRAGLALAWAAALGFSLGLALVYVASSLHIFKAHRLADRRIEFVLFALIGMAGLALTELLLWLLVGPLQLAPLAAKFATAGAVFLFNFSLRKALLFTAGPHALKMSP